MSLWTPGGEHAVPREPNEQPTEAGAPAPELDDETRSRAEAVAQEMAEVREQLASAPAAVVVANHAMGLYELGAIHLSRNPPNLAEAKVAIDAFAALVDTIGDRLGPDGATLRDALAQIRMAFVQIQAGAEEPPTEESGE